MKNLEITINWYIDNKEWLRKKENKINVLVTGSNGQLGKSLKYFYKKNSIYKLIFKTKAVKYY